MASQKSFTPQEAEERFDKLPKEVKDLLYSPEMRIIIKKVGDKNQLHIDQLGLLEAETGAAMLGFIEAQDFPLMLAESLGIERIKADTVAQDINDQLFSKIRESMKKVYEDNKKEPVFVVPSASPVPSTPPAAPTTSPTPFQPLSSVLPKNSPATPEPTPAAAPVVSTPKPPALPPVVPPVAPKPPTPSINPSTPPSAPSKPLTSAPDMHPADVMLNEKTVQVAPPAKTTPPQPGIYKADPYREPPE